MIQSIELTPGLQVAKQPQPSDMEALAADGVKTVICNRPDGEDPDQPTMDAMEQAAVAQGMKFIRYPVTPQTFPGEDLDGLGKVFDSSDKTFAYCRTGTRCANLWVASRSANERQAAAETAHALGYDLALSARLM